MKPKKKYYETLTMRAPILLRTGQVVKMLKENLVELPSEWQLRKFMTGQSNEYFLKPVAYYILIKKRNSLYHKRDVEVFINWYNTKRLTEHLKQHESLEFSETNESTEIKSQEEQTSPEAEVDTPRTSEVV